MEGSGLGASTSNPHAVGRTFSAPLPQEVPQTVLPAAGRVVSTPPSSLHPIASEHSLSIEGRGVSTPPSLDSALRPIASAPLLPIDGRVGSSFPPPPPLPSAAEIEHNEVVMIKKVVRKWVASRRRMAYIPPLIVLLVSYIVGVGVFLLHYEQYSSWSPNTPPDHIYDRLINAFYFVTVTMTIVSGSGFFYWILQRRLHVLLSALSSVVQKRCTRPFLRTRVFKVLATLLGIVCFIVGGILIIMFAERRVVSIMGIGFGDLSFKETLGRILAIPWLLVACHIVPVLFCCISMKNDLIFDEKVLVHLLLKYKRRANGRPIEVC